MARTRTTTADPIGPPHSYQHVIIGRMLLRIASVVCVMVCATALSSAQTATREVTIGPGQLIEVVNLSGRVDVISEPLPKTDDESNAPPELKLKLTAQSKTEIIETDIVSKSTKGVTRILVSPRDTTKRIDLTISVPERSRLMIETDDGGIKAEGNFESIVAKTDTGTIAVDVPTDDLKYDLWWTTSKPRYLADFAVEEVKEKSGGRFQMKGSVGTPTPKKKKKKRIRNRQTLKSPKKVPRATEPPTPQMRKPATKRPSPLP